MASRIKNMTEGKPVFLIVTFALPLMVGNVFQQLYTVVDTMVVGKALGVGALAALGAADWLNWMMLGTIQGLTQGFGILMAQEFGAGRLERLRKVVGNATVLSALGAVLLLVIGQLIARPVLVLLQTPEEIIGNALLYLRIMFLGIPIVMAYNFLASILRSLGDGKTPLHAMIVAALTNYRPGSSVRARFSLGHRRGSGSHADRPDGFDPFLFPAYQKNRNADAAAIRFPHGRSSGAQAPVSGLADGAAERDHLRGRHDRTVRGQRLRRAVHCGIYGYQ